MNRQSPRIVRLAGWIIGSIAIGFLMYVPTLDPFQHRKIVIAEISAAKNDWVILRNNTRKPISLVGHYLTDGDSLHPLDDSDCSLLDPGEELQLVREGGDKGKKDFSGRCTQIWDEKNKKGKVWGLKKTGEMVALLTPAKTGVLDLVMFDEMSKDESVQRRDLYVQYPDNYQTIRRGIQFFLAGFGLLAGLLQETRRNTGIKPVIRRGGSGGMNEEGSIGKGRVLGT